MLITLVIISLTASKCEEDYPRNTSALKEQAHTEENQRTLMENQPLPSISWSMERDNLIKLKKLQNDRTINFFVYVFNEGVANPIGYYQVNKLSSVNSQLSCPEQIIKTGLSSGYATNVISSPSEDGSYGTNGDAVFGFTPEGVCIQTNMHYISSSVPINFPTQPVLFGVITTDQAKALLQHSLDVMNKQ